MFQSLRVALSHVVADELSVWNPLQREKSLPVRGRSLEASCLGAYSLSGPVQGSCRKRFFCFACFSRTDEAQTSRTLVGGGSGSLLGCPRDGLLLAAPWRGSPLCPERVSQCVSHSSEDPSLSSSACESLQTPPRRTLAPLMGKRVSVFPARWDRPFP